MISIFMSSKGQAKSLGNGRDSRMELGRGAVGSREVNLRVRESKRKWK